MRQVLFLELESSEEHKNAKAPRKIGEARILKSAQTILVRQGSGRNPEKFLPHSIAPLVFATLKSYFIRNSLFTLGNPSNSCIWPCLNHITAIGLIDDDLSSTTDSFDSLDNNTMNRRVIIFSPFRVNNRCVGLLFWSASTCAQICITFKPYKSTLGSFKDPIVKWPLIARSLYLVKDWS